MGQQDVPMEAGLSPAPAPAPAPSPAATSAPQATPQAAPQDVDMSAGLSPAPPQTLTAQGNTLPPQTATAGMMSPEAEAASAAAANGHIDTSDPYNGAAAISAIGAGAGEAALHTVNSTLDLVPAIPHNTLRKGEAYLHDLNDPDPNQPDSTGNPGMRELGYGGETLVELLMGDEAMKGLSLADRLVKSGQIAKLLQNSPRMVQALKMGASAGKAIDTLAPAEQAMVRNSPTLTRLVGAGMDAIRQGTVQGLESAANDDGTFGDRLKTGVEQGATATGIGAAIGGAGGLLAAGGAKAGDISQGLDRLNDYQLNAAGKDDVRLAMMDRVDKAEKALHQNYENGINDLHDRLDGAELDAQDNPLADKAKELLQKPTPRDHPATIAAAEAAGAKLDASTKKLLQQIADGTQPLTPEEEEAAAGAKKVKASNAPGPQEEEEELPPARPYTIQDLVKLRQYIRKAADSYEPGDINARTLKKLLYDNEPLGGGTPDSAFDDSMSQLAEDSGDDTAVQDYAALRSNYRNKIGDYDNKVIDNLRQGKFDDAAKAFVSTKRSGSALPSAGSVTTNMDALTRVLGPKGVRQFGREVFGTILSDATENGQVNAAKFMSTMNRVSAETKNRLFNMSATKSGLRSLMNDAQSAANLQRLNRLGVLGTAGFIGAHSPVHPELAVSLISILGATSEFAGIATARNMLDYVANTPKLWSLYRMAGKAAEGGKVLHGIPGGAVKLGAGGAASDLVAPTKTRDFENDPTGKPFVTPHSQQTVAPGHTVSYNGRTGVVTGQHPNGRAIIQWS
jgi:hypothetical protein